MAFESEHFAHVPGVNLQDPPAYKLKIAQVGEVARGEEKGEEKRGFLVTPNIITLK
jgi:hypothetical protein